MKIQWKYTEKASLRQAGSVKYFQIRIPNYFTERSGVYFYRISTVFRTSYFVFLPNSRVPPKQSIAYHKLMRLVWEQIAL